MTDAYLRYRWPNLYRHSNNLNLPDDPIEQTVSNFNAVCSNLNINVFETPNSKSSCTVPTNYVMDLITYSSTAITALLKEREDSYQLRLKNLSREREELAKEREDLTKEREELAKYREYLRVQNDPIWETKSAHDEDCVLGIALEPTHEYDSSSEFCPGDTPDHISESLDSEDDKLSSELREMRNADDDYYMLNVMRALWNEVSAKRVEGNQSEDGEEEEEAGIKEQESVEEEEQESEQQEEPGFQENPLSASQYGSYYTSSSVEVPIPYFTLPYNSNPLQAASSSSTSPPDCPMDPAFLDGIALQTFSPAEVSSQYTVESNIPQKRQRDEQLE
ncbi:hypothetical protein N7493_000183 [Penicillium malachiteum]|uniref:Uncharacterized protein n=1 Tax=Penicillium malachiteum TaxID=1324776 RepID=A0AAD6HVV3_9EURO|nr:hypothetical protein N7493_000183 [Penicillium malachiteum]